MRLLDFFGFELGACAVFFFFRFVVCYCWVASCFVRRCRVHVGVKKTRRYVEKVSVRKIYGNFLHSSGKRPTTKGGQIAGTLTAAYYTCSYGSCKLSRASILACIFRVKLILVHTVICCWSFAQFY